MIHIVPADAGQYFGNKGATFLNPETEMGQGLVGKKEYMSRK
jgi:hypothetical protein